MPLLRCRKAAATELAEEIHKPARSNEPQRGEYTHCGSCPTHGVDLTV